ncbi:hypothetical protein EYV94_14375 [Puteibacter caeruleilacunae]|nr:hypothetical protein EYV94_14375 [Puteibacter caeruleilacunae]
MIKRRNYWRLFGLLICLSVIACSSNNEQKGKAPFGDYLTMVQKEYQAAPTDSTLKVIFEKLMSEFPYKTQALFQTVKGDQLSNYIKGKDTEKTTKQILSKYTDQVKPFDKVFKDKIKQTQGSTLQLELFSEMVTFKQDLKDFSEINIANLKAAINNISSRYPKQYKGDKFIASLSTLEQSYSKVKAMIDKTAPETLSSLPGFVAEYSKLKKEALLSNPLVTEAPIVFITRKQYQPDHHNTATLFQTDEINTNSFTPGAAMKVIDLKKGGKITTLIETTDGIVRDPEVRYDGKEIVFSMRNNIEEDYHIYKMDANGANIKQLTSAVGVADIDPQYLPDGDIVFTSTREPKYCMCNVHIMGNLFRMEDDGANVTQLGKSTLFEGHSTIMPDGRILYDRWEYVDRNFGDAQGLWTMNPDGTNQAIYFGNNTNSPGGYIDARPIPGTDKVLALLGSCHDRPWGALGIINRNKGMDGKQAIERTWPSWARDLVDKGNWDTFKRVKPLYEDPFPLDDTYFLCSRTIGVGEKMGLYLVDMFGNEQLIHTEGHGCYDPVPIKPRAKEQQIEDKRNYKTQTGKFYVQNVYQGTHMKGVKPGTVKYLRVVESVEKKSWTGPAWNGQGVHRPAMNWHSFECKKILGTVPVEEDGSAYVEVPADAYVYFQLLDENKMMIQSMRSGTMVHSGETLGCIGCHDDRRMAPPSSNNYTAMALAKAPQKLNGWHGGVRQFGFMEEVQPVLNKHCVQCHDFNKKAGKKLLLAGDRNPYFNAAYIDLHMKRAIKTVGAGPAAIQEAYSWGSHPSKMIKMIKKGHGNVKLTTEEMEILTTWIDLNAVYYSDFISAYPDNTVGRSPISQKDLNRLGQLTKVNFGHLGGHGRRLGAQISFERPALSPCLKNIRNKKSDEYKEALAIIQKGKEQLQKHPRLDMKGFIPSPKDQQRLDKYKYRKDQEMENRKAILEGGKHYDPELSQK